MKLLLTIATLLLPLPALAVGEYHYFSSDSLPKTLGADYAGDTISWVGPGGPGDTAACKLTIPGAGLTITYEATDLVLDLGTTDATRDTLVYATGTGNSIFALEFTYASNDINFHCLGGVFECDNDSLDEACHAIYAGNYGTCRFDSTVFFVYGYEVNVAYLPFAHNWEFFKCRFYNRCWGYHDRSYFYYGGAIAVDYGIGYPAMASDEFTIRVDSCYMEVPHMGIYCNGYTLLHQEYTITDATNATPIVITTAENISQSNPFTDGDSVAIFGVAGNTAANGRWAVDVLTANTFSLVGSSGNGSYSSGGTVVFTYDIETGFGDRTFLSRVHIVGDSIIPDARNDYYSYPSAEFWQGSTNSGAISLTGVLGGSVISGNVIRAGLVYSGFDVGIGFSDCQGGLNNPDDTSQWIHFEDNDIEGHRGLDAFYGQLSGKIMKYRDYDPNNGSNKRIFIRRNRGTMYSDGDPATDSISSEANGFELQSWISTDSLGEPKGCDSFIVITGNYWASFSLDTLSTANAMRIEIDGTDANYKWKDAGNLFKNNVLESNFRIWDSGPISYDETGNYFRSIEDTIRRPAVYDHSSWALVAMGSTYYLGHGCEIINPVLEDGITEADLWEDPVATQIYDWSVYRTLKIKVQGTGEHWVNGADVWVVNVFGDTVFTGTTGSDGLVEDTVRYIYLSLSTDSSYNDFVLGAAYAGDTTTVTGFTVASNNYSDTLLLTATVGNGDSTGAGGGGFTPNPNDFPLEQNIRILDGVQIGGFPCQGIRMEKFGALPPVRLYL
jgi:hypothetical protein